MSYEDAKQLWQGIVDYAEACHDLGAEGNSGEFHDQRTFNELFRDRQKALDHLALLFRKHTGFTPMYDDNNDSWVLIGD